MIYCRYEHNEGIYPSVPHHVMFYELLDVDREAYIQDTITINNKIDVENKPKKEYNETAVAVIDKVKLLKSWDEFIEFDGKKYGQHCQNQTLII
jgi:hypothetical protein